MIKKFYTTERGPAEHIATQEGYHIFLAQSDLDLLMVEPQGEEDKYQKVIPIVIKGDTIPFKKINGNVARKQKLELVPDFYKIFIVNGVMGKLNPKE